ncbi:branched-chain amino acid ABC transporter permease [Pseudonocardia xishanensis]|uniref:Branched-chain amino acid ABC transporter permease n=1 Tax=Pseudonocardia xishanensis TaxID=630995 RepID=A0ABP8RFD3_9PSEU
MSDVWQLVVQGVTSGAVYAIAAASIVLMYRTTRLFNFAIGAMIALAAYLLYALTDAGLPFAVAAPLAVLAVGVVAAVFYRLVPARMVRQAHWVAIVSTLAFGILIEGLLGVIWLGNNYTVATPWTPSLVDVGGGAQVQGTGLVTFAVMVVCCGAAALVVSARRLGARFTAAATHAVVADARGIPTARFHVAAWLLGGLLAGVAGVAYGSTASVGFGVVLVGFAAFPAAIIGGLDSVPGSMIAGSLLGIVQAVLTRAGLGDAFGAVAFALAVGVLVVRPTGLLGSREALRV